MGRISLKRLTFSGFRSFAGITIVDFPDSGMVLVRGKNLDTAGSSGSGKTTINLAIAYALGFCPFPATTLQSWLTEDPLSVTLELDTPKGRVILTRGKTLSLKVGDAKPVKGSASAVEKALDELIGLDSMMRGALTYRGQKKPGLFLSKGDTEKKEFLTLLLGLNKFEEAIETAQQNIISLKTKVDQYQGSVVQWEKTYDETPEAIEPTLIGTQILLEKIKELENLTIVQETLLQEEKTKYFKQLENFNPDLSELNRASCLLTVCRQKKCDTVTSDLRKQREQQQQAGVVQREISTLQNKISELSLLNNSLHSLKDESASLAKNVCPTCEREWNKALIRLDFVNLEITKIVEEINKIKQLEPQVVEFEEKLKVLQLFSPNPDIQKLTDIENSLVQQLVVEQQKLKTSETMYKMESEQVISRISNLIGNLTAELLQKKHEVALIEMNNKRAIEIWKQQQETIAKVCSGELKARSLLQDAQADLNAELDFVDLVGREGFLGAIFDEALSEISQETNRLLAGLPNVSHCTLWFRSESTTQKGTVKKSIVPVITIHGHEAPLNSGASSGMITAIELAVDLAVSSVVSRRTGSYPGWLLLDESFEGLDKVTKECCFELLNRYAGDRLVLIVDHSSELQQMFSQFIDIEYEGGISKIV